MAEEGYRSGFFVNRRGRRLFYAVEGHDDGGVRQAPVWILCSPTLEEKTVSHPVCRHLARAIAQAGGCVLRVDYEGHGDSEGEVSELGLDDWVHDVVDAALLLTNGAPRPVSLIGVRAGALIAAAAARPLDAAALVAVCPVLLGADYLNDLLRINVTAQFAVHKGVRCGRPALIAALDRGATVNVLGWEIGGAFARTVRDARFRPLVDDLRCPVVVIDLQRPDDAGPPPVLSAPDQAPRVITRGVRGVQFWDDPKVVDPAPEALTRAVVETTCGMPR